MFSGGGAHGPGSKGPRGGPGRNQGDGRQIRGQDDKPILFQVADVEFPAGTFNVKTPLYFVGNSLTMKPGQKAYKDMTGAELTPTQITVGGIKEAQYREASSGQLVTISSAVLKASLKPSQKGPKLDNAKSV
jgi:hypothetical protein